MRLAAELNLPLPAVLLDAGGGPYISMTSTKSIGWTDESLKLYHFSVSRS